MKLTGKCKEDFEKWYCKLIEDLREDYHGYPKTVILTKFEREIDSMKYGVYVDFFDSEGLRINIIEKGLMQYQIVFWEYDGDKKVVFELFDTRTEARTEAIRVANQIFNER